MAHHLQRQGVLAAIEEQVRFARRRFGRYEVIDFVAVLFGYAISGERTRGATYTRRSIPGQARLWRSLDEIACQHVRRSRAFSPPLIRLRSRPCEPSCLQDLLARPLNTEEHMAGLWDRQGASVGRLRCGWHPEGSPPTPLAENGGSASATAPVPPAV